MLRGAHRLDARAQEAGEGRRRLEGGCVAAAVCEEVRVGLDLRGGTAQARGVMIVNLFFLLSFNSFCFFVWFFPFSFFFFVNEEHSYFFLDERGAQLIFFSFFS